MQQTPTSDDMYFAPIIPRCLLYPALGLPSGSMISIKYEDWIPSYIISSHANGDTTTVCSTTSNCGEDTMEPID